MTDSQQIDLQHVIDTLKGIGVETMIYAVHPLEGWHEELSLAAVTEHLRAGSHVDEMWARQFGVPLAHFRRLKTFYADGCQCTGQNRRGQRCGTTLYSQGQAPIPRTFVFGRHDRCQHHQELSEVDRE